MGQKLILTLILAELWSKMSLSYYQMLLKKVYLLFGKITETHLNYLGL
ncbi:hypothetical protein SAMN04488104_10492 [Algoriphagus faecimaris]|uniref:Uncharacterized protein n=1 Tax=Algoriphagus faecimaris TaxID=686796 RepID=A0A1G6WZN4_9BACT|nr:hypothetical protein SAMN04488104_10492 [Algoriphagus faecimaris]